MLESVLVLQTMSFQGHNAVYNLLLAARLLQYMAYGTVGFN